MNPLSTELAGPSRTESRPMSPVPPSPRRKAFGTAREAVDEVLVNLIGVMEQHGGLLPSCLDLGTHAMPTGDPGLLPGQRPWDRALTGCNLMHDMPLLGLLYSLGEGEEKVSYREAADAYLDAFLQRCTRTPSGLFPWGEHSFWNLRDECLGDSIKAAWPEAAEKLGKDGLPEPAWHDHLRQAPVWFWGKVAEKNPEAFQRFADGLDRHWVSDERDEYNRHGGINRLVRMGRGERSCDFPRHSGFYVLDLACAWREDPRPETFAQMRRFADYWWDKRGPDGCLRVESRSPASATDFFDVLCPSQTLSLGVSLMEAAEVLREIDPRVAAELFQRGQTYCRAYGKAPHPEGGGRLVGGYRGDTGQACKALPVFGSAYGIYPQSQAAVLCCAAYRHLGDIGLLDLAMAAARTCLREAGTIREKDAVPALDAGTTLELFADLYDLTGDEEWLEAGRTVWPVIRERYFSRGLVRVAAGCDWYEAQQGTGFLLHGAARFAMMEESVPTIPPEYSAR